jgi:hypothetical protein
MTITTHDAANKAVKGWLDENGHQVKPVEDTSTNFHYEIDYPLGSMKKQRVIQPKDYPGLCVLLNGVAIADDHKKQLNSMAEEEREAFYNEIRKDLIFLDNSYDMNTDEKGIVQQIQFSYEFYFDALTKTQLFRGLLLNHRTLLYIITKFNERFGVPVIPDSDNSELGAKI